ncbi:uncharacterized protein [Procambarus clarkii]|uniref:uncharacterized protein n=1 Tax=Procambarus clarkii TaxID=6728 RepID=UPI0037438BAA
MFTVDKQETVWTSDTPYEALRRQLAPLVDFNSSPKGSNVSSTTAVYEGLRLKLMNGSIPYVPCQIRMYEARDVEECMTARRARGFGTWIAFYGDSTMRQKMHVLLNFLPPGLIYSYFLNGIQVTLEEFITIVAHQLELRPTIFEILGHRAKDFPTSQKFQPTLDSLQGNDVSNVTNHYNGFTIHIGNNFETNIKIDAERLSALFLTSNNEPTEKQDHGAYEVRVTLVWATCGSRSGEGRDRDAPKVTKLQEWARADVIPDIIILGFGKWFLHLRYSSGELDPFTELDFWTRPLVEPLTLLANRTRVLLLAQSRSRSYNFVNNYVSGEDKQKVWDTKLETTIYSDSLPLIDTWFGVLLRQTGVWLWDSTLPFNLANILECSTLKENNFFDNSFYTGRWWMCTDANHASFETNANELQMMFNYMCNNYLKTSQQYCCSGNPSLGQAR